MLDDVTLVIPSGGRPRSQITLAQLPAWAARKALLAVREREAAEYRVANPGANVWAVPDGCEGIAGKRRHIMANCPTRYLMMIDDDTRFTWRPDMSSTSLVRLPAGDRRVGNMLIYCRQLAAEYAHVGVSARQGNNHVARPLKTCCRMHNVSLYDLARVRAAAVTPFRLQVMEDFDLTLQLLKAGLPNAVTYRWCWDCPSANSPGGCSAWRTPEMQTQCANALAELHPGLVRVVTKRAKLWLGMNERTDVVVYWQKAFGSAATAPLGGPGEAGAGDAPAHRGFTPTSPRTASGPSARGRG